MNSPLGPIPAHVPPHLVRDVDVHNLVGGSDNPYLAWSIVQKNAPDIYYTPRYGGYWVMNRAEYFTQVFNDHDRFSSTCNPMIPAPPDGTPPFIPLQNDPPDHRFFRHPFAMALSPQRIRDLGAHALEIVIERIDSFLDRGECEFVHDMALHVPVGIIMKLLDLPFEDRARLFPLVDTLMHGKDMMERGQSVVGIMAYVDEWIVKRKQNPGNDFISHYLKSTIDGRPIMDHEVSAAVTVVIIGGLDSVSHSMCGMMRFLAEHPGHQQQIVDNPEIIPDALEELLRRHSVTSTTRILTEDAELGGVKMKKGERVILELCLHGLDEKQWPDPLQVNFSRQPKGIMNFGSGIHKCVGGNLARAELRALLEEWFQRIPRFAIKPGARVKTMTGQSQGMSYLPLVWE